MKKILILMSERTGTGHKSSANAIDLKLKEKKRDARTSENLFIVFE